jgi:hypothetical protein
VHTREGEIEGDREREIEGERERERERANFEIEGMQRSTFPHSR